MNMKRIALGILGLLLLCSCAFGVVYLVRHVPTRPGVKISSMSVSPIELSAEDSKITANWVIDFEVQNNNKKHSLNYTEFEVSVTYYGVEFLSMVKMWPFQLARGNHTRLTAEVKALNQNINRETGIAIRADLEDDGVISFDVNVRLKYENDDKGSSRQVDDDQNGKKRGTAYSYLCGDVEVGYPRSTIDGRRSSGFMLGRSRKCESSKIHN